MPTRQTSTPNRREFLRGFVYRKEVKPEPIRPPWTNTQLIADRCTSCNSCIEACPETILFADSKGRPAVSFDAGECTFCGDCASACEDLVFDTDQNEPWQMDVTITNDCLLPKGITCQICTDLCDVDALRFDMRVRPIGAIRLDADACTGCGACIAPCPASAIKIQDLRMSQAA